jgi:NAD-dependent dihydropyrimidine dehydrogenase PreA subunit
VDPALLPDLTYQDDETWVEVELPGEHAGILSSVAYLMRFQTNRARANRFYDSFLCQPFNPPSSGIPAATEESAKQTDLQQRDGCKYCHALLEPAAAHWGRWTELGAAWLDPETYPAYREDCDKCQGCAQVCTSYYLVNASVPAEEEFTGMLKAYVYRSEQHHQNVESGPSLLALSTLDDGRVAQCAGRSTTEWLLGRALSADEQAFAAAVTDGFVESGYSWKSLVRAIVTSPVYRRVR